MTGVLLAATLAATGPTPLTGPSPHFAQPVACRVGERALEARCGTIEVPEDPDLKTSRRLSLKFVILPAKRPVRNALPIFVLAGGPGQAATQIVDDAADFPMRDHHDLVFLDERGTGGAQPLACETGRTADQDLTDSAPLPFSRTNALACLARWNSKVDLRQYSSYRIAGDIDRLRQALAIPRIGIMAGSFGTYTATVYGRYYPRRLGAAYLISAVPPDILIPLDTPRSAQSGFDQRVADCQEDRQCRLLHPDIPGDLNRVLQRLAQAPVHITIRSARTGAPQAVTLTRDNVADLVRILLYADGDSLPQLLEDGANGNFEPLAKLLDEYGRTFYDRINLAMHLSVICTQMTNRIDPASVRSEIESSFLGGARIRGQMDACSVWPRTILPQGYFEPFRVHVPTLIVSGTRDPVTPPTYGRKLGAWMPNSLHVIISGGHFATNDCVEQLAVQMFDRMSIKGLEDTCSVGADKK